MTKKNIKKLPRRQRVDVIFYIAIIPKGNVYFTPKGKFSQFMSIRDLTQLNRNKFPAEEWVVCMNEIFIGFKSIMNYLTAA